MAIFSPVKSIIGAPLKGIVPPAAPGNAAQVVRNTTGFDPSSSSGVVAPVSSPASTPASSPSGVPYGSILQSDPAYAQAGVDATQNAGDAAAARTSAIRQAIVQYGGLPTGFQDKYGDADQATLDIANSNPFSLTAQNQRQFGQTQEKDRQAEAANGSIFSGQAPTDIGNEEYANGLNLYGLGQQFGQAVSGAIGQYTGALDMNRTNLTNALFQSEKNQETNPAYAPAPAPSPTRVPSAPVVRLTTPKHKDAFVPTSPTHQLLNAAQVRRNSL